MTRSLLITGCSSGIGYDAALRMRDRGWRVFAACRKPEDCARLRDEGFESPLMDYEAPETLSAGLAEVLDATGGTLDALFNNGAYAVPGAVEDLPPAALNQLLQANLVGWHDLTCQVIPVMRAQGHGRIVNHSSVLGLVTLPWRGAYNCTKFALEGLTNTLRIEMRDTNIHVVLLNTGPVTSRIRENSIPHFEQWINWRSSARAVEYEATLLKRLYDDSGTPDTFELPASAVSDKLVHALESKRPRARYYITKPTWIMDIAKRLLPTEALDRLLAKV